MDIFKSPKTQFYFGNELKNIPKPPSKEVLSHLQRSPFLPKKETMKDSQKNNQKKTNTKKNIFSPIQAQKKNLNPKKTKSGNVIKETILFNVPNRGKGRSLEKVPSSKNNQGKNLFKNYLDFYMDKRNQKIKNVYANEKNKIRNNSKERKVKNEENKKKNNYVNFNLIKNNNKEIYNEPEGKDFNKFNSVCVSINNNYNYNLSLGNENQNNEKPKEKIETWQEKLNRINKIKENMNNLDCKQLTESDFFKNKIAKREKKEKERENIFNKTENNYNFKQKIRELNSAPPPSSYNVNNNINQKKDINDNINMNNEIKNPPKKRTGILGFLQAFKDFLEPINLRKKANIKNNNTEHNNTNNNISNININNNKINLNLKVKEKQVLNIPSTPKTENNDINENIYNKYTNANSVNTTPKITLYERKNILNKNEEYNNNYNTDYNNKNNYIRDDAYDSCPISNNSSYTYNHKNINKIKDENAQQILSHSQKNIFQNNNNNNNVYIKGRTDLNQYQDNKDYYNNKSEVEKKETGLFNIFGFGKNKQKKIPENINNINNNNNNNLIKNFYGTEKINPIEKQNYSTTYIKKPNRLNSPPHVNSYDKDIRPYNQIGQNASNNIFAKYLNNLDTPKEYMNKPIIKKKLLEKFNDDYNEENIEENLNINAEKKIQEIKINIRQKRSDYNNNYDTNYSYNNGSRRHFDNYFQNQNSNKINHSAVYLNKKDYNNLDELNINPKPKNKIETCVINFNKKPNKYINNVYNTPKPSYNKNMLIDNNDDYNGNNYKYYNTNINNNNNYNDNNLYSKPFDLSLSQRNLTHNININNQNMNIDSDTDNQSINSAYTAKPIRKKIAINKSDKNFKINKTSNMDSDNTDSESNSEYSEISQISTKSVKPNNTIYFKHFKSFFNKNKNNGGGIANSFLNKIFKKDSKKYDTDSSFNSEKSDISINNINNNSVSQPIINKNISFSKKPNNLAINNVTPLPDDDNYYKKNTIKIIKQKISNKKLNLFKKIYNYGLNNPKNIKNGYYISKTNLKVIKLPQKKASIYTKYYFKLIQKPKIKQNCIDKKRIIIKEGIKLPLTSENYYLTKKFMIKYVNENADIFENLDINQESLNINEEIKNKNKNYFSPKKNKAYEKNNDLIYSPQFGTKKEPADSDSETHVLNPSRSARDLSKINNIDIDDNNNNKIYSQQSTPNRNSNYIYNNKNPSETLYIKKKPNMKKLSEENKSKTYFKGNKKLYQNFNIGGINDFNINPENKESMSKKNKIISIDINLKNGNNNLTNNINNIKINNDDNIKNKIISIIDKLSNKINNTSIIVNNLFIVITKNTLDNANNQIRLPFMEILSNENIFAKIIINKSIEENNQQRIANYAIICQQLCFKLNDEINLNTNNPINQTDEDLKTILTEECKVKFENILNNNYNINENSLFGIIIFISELIKVKMISINFGFYIYESLYRKYKIANINKYYYLDMIIIFLNNIGNLAIKEKMFWEINNFIDNELINLINKDMNLPLFIKNKIIELAKIKKYQWMIEK